MLVTRTEGGTNCSGFVPVLFQCDVCRNEESGEHAVTPPLHHPLYRAQKIRRRRACIEPHHGPHPPAFPPTAASIACPFHAHLQPCYPLSPRTYSHAHTACAGRRSVRGLKSERLLRIHIHPLPLHHTHMRAHTALSDPPPPTLWSSLDHWNEHLYQNSLRLMVQALLWDGRVSPPIRLPLIVPTSAP